MIILQKYSVIFIFLISACGVHHSPSLDSIIYLDNDKKQTINNSFPAQVQDIKDIKNNAPIPSNISTKTIISNAYADQGNRSKLKKGFKGDSLPELIKKFEKIKKDSKDEFTKTSELNTRLSNLLDRPYRFTISAENHKIENYTTDDIKYAARYDADSETLLVNLWIEKELLFTTNQIISFPYQKRSLFYPTVIVVNKKDETSYIGQNAFGVMAKIYESYEIKYGLAFVNIPLPENPHYIKNYTSEHFGPPPSIFSLSLPVDPHFVRKIKKDLAFYLDIQPIKLNNVEDIILKTGHGLDATIIDPYGVYTLKKYLLSVLKEIGVYRKSTGEILGWKKF